ncbi:hypothetical protein [Sphingomonas rubra]|uniref:Uncharacterized protein n=1 Tax=Sphingomonas rubra TaxID=634430 RepID=A0A1I5UF77_9SPHN|nr:hypothetical protein [Sphingomonas rubra]SFP93687.1 hypothetical protein SAMN04488241_111119 [Sphingomonas rubra]
MTITLAAVLILVLIGGWLLGLASSSGGRKWKERYAAERAAHATYRRDADARITAADARTAELEREHARLAQAAPVTASTTAPRATAAAAAARPAYPVGERRGWFEFNRR